MKLWDMPDFFQCKNINHFLITAKLHFEVVSFHIQFVPSDKAKYSVGFLFFVNDRKSRMQRWLF